MRMKKSWWPVIIFNLAYIFGFLIYYISIQNYEFLGYMGILILLFLLVLLTIKKTKFDLFVLWGLSIWGFLHMIGGGLPVGDGVLYGWEIIHIFGSGDSFVLRLDQVVHAFGFFMTTFVAYHLLKPYLNNRANYAVIYPGLVLISMGLGALNEIFELGAVVILGNTGVGGYYNTLIDIVANTIGATIAAIVIHFRRKHSKKGY